MHRLAAGRGFERHPGIGLISCFLARKTKGPNRGAHRDFYQKTVALESSYGDQGGRNRRVHAGADWPAWKAAPAMRGLPEAVPEGSRHSTRARVARSVHAKAALDLALSSAPVG